MEPIITYEDDDERADFETFLKGARWDVIVSIGEKRYKLSVITPLRLQQDISSGVESSGLYISDPNLVIVNEVTKSEIEKTVRELYEGKYFERLDNMGF